MQQMCNKSYFRISTLPHFVRCSYERVSIVKCTGGSLGCQRSSLYINQRFWAMQFHKRQKFFWCKVLHSNESKFNLFGSDGKSYCCRRVVEAPHEWNVKKTVKHGRGSIMVWGYISWKGPRHLHRVEGYMDAKQYTRILSESFLGSFHNYKVQPRNTYFQQDNDPKHTSKLEKKMVPRQEY